MEVGTASVDETDFDMGNLQSEVTVDLCVNVLVRPVLFLSPVRGRKAACSTPPERCKARPGRRLRTAVCSAGRVESLVYRGSSSPYTVHLCLGVRGPALRNCVASRVV